MTPTHLSQRQDFSDTLALRSGTSAFASSWANADPIEQMAQSDRADWVLLRLVCCATLATLVLALASTLRG
jgi:hypothetical protein